MLFVDSGIKFIHQQLAAELADWNHYKKAGYIFDNQTQFKLPNGSHISPDLCWVVLEQWDALSNEEKQSVPPVCPDFVIEIFEGDKSLEQLRLQMREYIKNGTRLGWLINPQKSSVEIYRVRDVQERNTQKCDILEYDIREIVAFGFRKAPTLLGENVLPGFSVDLQDLFNIQLNYRLQHVA
ncbi:Uma2 family endonuclease [Mastigocoleus testarum]|uniref:Putative restriction endonuclease domain-containing protein n=1 Tax=Mastigocoleus testarum BC008 TaxID=371196 RepID=A0A0V7ZRX4_9CYAN|nr:Uma2 family endonuclease [Mastigocoleus testarum]KST66973.1 hypothetical protein BC008_27680 [Mastigocoleus testarum BC008]KST67138.1 hypothetical protein BC008_28500 [Mastigocoleus testarum BC008]